MTPGIDEDATDASKTSVSASGTPREREHESRNGDQIFDTSGASQVTSLRLDPNFYLTMPSQLSQSQCSSQNFDEESCGDSDEGEENVGHGEDLDVSSQNIHSSSNGLNALSTMQLQTQAIDFDMDDLDDEDNDEDNDDDRDLDGSDEHLNNDKNKNVHIHSITNDAQTKSNDNVSNKQVSSADVKEKINSADEVNKNEEDHEEFESQDFMAKPTSKVPMGNVDTITRKLSTVATSQENLHETNRRVASKDDIDANNDGDPISIPATQMRDNDNNDEGCCGGGDGDDDDDKYGDVRRTRGAEVVIPATLMPSQWGDESIDIDDIGDEDDDEEDANTITQQTTLRPGFDEQSQSTTQGTFFRSLQQPTFRTDGSITTQDAFQLENSENSMNNIENISAGRYNQQPSRPSSGVTSSNEISNRAMRSTTAKEGMQNKSILPDANKEDMLKQDTSLLGICNRASLKDCAHIESPMTEENKSNEIEDRTSIENEVATQEERHENMSEGAANPLAMSASQWQSQDLDIYDIESSQDSIATNEGCDFVENPNTSGTNTIPSVAGLRSTSFVSALPVLSSSLQNGSPSNLAVGVEPEGQRNPPPVYIKMEPVSASSAPRQNLENREGETPISSSSSCYRAKVNSDDSTSRQMQIDTDASHASNLTNERKRLSKRPNPLSRRRTGDFLDSDSEDEEIDRLLGRSSSFPARSSSILKNSSSSPQPEPLSSVSSSRITTLQDQGEHRRNKEKGAVEKKNPSSYRKTSPTGGQVDDRGKPQITSVGILQKGDKTPTKKYKGKSSNVNNRILTAMTSSPILARGRQNGENASLETKGITPQTEPSAMPASELANLVLFSSDESDGDSDEDLSEHQSTQALARGAPIERKSIQSVRKVSRVRFSDTNEASSVKRLRIETGETLPGESSNEPKPLESNSTNSIPKRDVSAITQITPEAVGRRSKRQTPLRKEKALPLIHDDDIEDDDEADAHFSLSTSIGKTPLSSPSTVGVGVAGKSKQNAKYAKGSRKITAYFKQKS